MFWLTSLESILRRFTKVVEQLEKHIVSKNEEAVRERDLALEHDSKRAQAVAEATKATKIAANIRKLLEE